MKQRIVKLTSIIEDVTEILLNSHQRDIDIKLRFLDDRAEITFSMANPVIGKKELDELLEVFNAPRQRELEYYYHSLSGDSLADVNVSVLSNMVDEAHGSLTDECLNLVVTRLYTTLG